MARRLAVFAYGSLVSAPSAARTLDRPLAEPVAVHLSGWTRRWTLCRDNLRSEKTFARADDGAVPPFCLGLNLEPDDDNRVNGALLTLNDDELERLDRRELRYDRVDVTAAIDGAPGFDRVFTYTAKAKHHAPAPPEGAIVIASYVREVDAAFASLGRDQLDLYRESTTPPPVEVVEAVLVRDEIPEGNPREW